MSEPVKRVAPWEDLVLRLIGVYKLIHAALFMAVGFGLLRLRHHNLVDVLNQYIVVPFRLNSDNPAEQPLPENSIVYWTLKQAEAITPHTLSLIGWAAFFYAALFAVEGIGLYLRKHWAEYLVVVVTGSLLPFEIFEMFHKAAWWKLGIIVGNLAIVGYLIHRLVLDARLKQPRGDETRLAAPSPAAPAVQRNGTASGTERHVTTKVP